MFDIDVLKGYRPLVLSTRVQTAAVCLAACFVALPAASRAATWERAEWTEAPIGDAVYPGDRKLWNGRILLRGPGLSAEQQSEIASGVEARVRALFETDEWAAPV